MLGLFLSVLLATGACLAAATPGLPVSRHEQYHPAPKAAPCPSEPLVRLANGISQSEAAWLQARLPKANAALKTWLKSTGQDFDTTKLPILGLSTSGGGLRSLLVGAGLHKAFDSRDSNVSTSGLYQAISYESALSGGSWLLSSLSANNWPTITSLQNNLWMEAFQYPLTHPPHNQTVRNIALAARAKYDANFKVGIVDVYGPLLGVELLYGANGGIKKTVSGLAQLSNFTAHNVPYPIITSIGTLHQGLYPPANATQYEFHPYEFGSWDDGVNAFTPIRYLGSNLSNGKPVKSDKCITGFDTQDFILGTSSNVFPYLKGLGFANISYVKGQAKILKSVNIPYNNESFFAAYPNPFFEYPGSSLVQNLKTLNLVDGSLSNQSDPIWPMLHRPVDVLFASANSDDTVNFYPSGVEIHDTFLQAKAQHLTRMPYIPPVRVFREQRLTKRPTVFGCDEPDKMTIVYLANRNITIHSGSGALEPDYGPKMTAAGIADGFAIATDNGKEGFGACLGCVVMKKTGGKLPKVCDACFKEYCFMPTPKTEA